MAHGNLARKTVLVISEYQILSPLDRVLGKLNILYYYIFHAFDNPFLHPSQVLYS